MRSALILEDRQTDRTQLTGAIREYANARLRFLVTTIRQQSAPSSCVVQSSVSQTSLLAVPFWLRKITTDPHILVGRDSSVGIATCYGLEGQGIESRWRLDFPHLSRPSLGHTQPPV